MTGQSKLSWSALALLLILTTTPALADEGRIPLWEPTVLDSTIAGVDISGNYIVTQNISAVGGMPALLVICDGNDEVHIDLNGFTLYGDPGGGVHIIEAVDCRSLTVRNGSLRASGPPPGDSLHVERSEKVIAEDLRITDGANGIFLIESLNFVIRRNTIVGADPDAIVVDGGALPDPVTGTIEANVVKQSVGGGITVTNNHASVAVSNNRIDRTLNGSGIYMASGNGCIVAENTVQGAAQEGILMELIQNCKLHNNVSGFNSANGILLINFNDGMVLDNVSGNNSLSGIEHAGERTLFDRNVVNNNDCYGLHLGGRGNTYGRNTARLNLGAAVCGAACGVGPVEICPAPYGGGATPPDLCVDAIDNISLCDNLMPGPPRS